MMIKRRVFEKLPWPWFDCAVDPNTPDSDGHDRCEYLSEDYYFCKCAREAGMSVKICMGVQGLHFGWYPYSIMDRMYYIENNLPIPRDDGSVLSS